MNKRGYFQIWELLSKPDYEQFGERGWRFVDPVLLKVVNRIRNNLGKPITANNWKNGGPFQWRGVRTAKYSGHSITSMHSWGRALDFDVAGMQPKEVVSHMLENSGEYPEITFIEIDINWVHIDVGQRENTEGLNLWSPVRGYVEINDYLEELTDDRKSSDS